MVATFTPEKSAPPRNAKKHIRCGVCHVKDHNWRTCPHNDMVKSTRPGQKRIFCKKFSLNSKTLNIQRLKLFTNPVPDHGRELGSEKILDGAKKVVFQELHRLRSLVEADGISGFERAWFEASGETELWFNFGAMHHNVMNARFGVRDMDDDSFGYNNALRVVLNKNKPMNQDEIAKTLLHEVMHHNVTRSFDGRSMNENIDHLALALLGDPNECDNFKLGWLNCPHSRCRSDRCLKFDWD